MPRKKLTRKTKLALGLLVLCPFAVYAWLFHDVIQADWAYGSTYEAAEKEGAIVTAQDLRSRYGASDEDNAAPMIQAAVEKWMAISKQERHALEMSIHTGLPHPDGSAKPANPHGVPIDEALEMMDRVLSGLPATLAKSKCDFRYRYEMGLYLTMDQIAPMKEFAVALTVEAIRAARSAKFDQAASKLRLASHLGHLLSCRPGIIPSLASIGVHAITKQGCISALLDARDNSAARQQLIEALSEWRGGISVRPAIDYEMFLLWTTVSSPTSYEKQAQAPRDPDSDQEDGHDRQSASNFSIIPGIKRAWRMRALEGCRAMQKLVVDSKDDPIAFQKLAPGLDEEFGPKDFKASYLMNVILGPVVSGFGNAIARDVANHELVLAAGEVLDERQRLGHWPDRLPVFRRDPFGSAELKYRVAGDHAVIWSIGVDHVDSQGRKSNDLPTPNDSKDDDIAVHL